MHQTTIRFQEEIWARIEHQARAGGISAAAFVREAALMRLAAIGAAGNGAPADRRDSHHELASRFDARETSEAVWRQAHRAREQSRAIRAAAQLLHPKRGGTTS